jgi:hypothetical protein
MFEVENDFYKAYIEEFRSKYPEKELVIIGEQIIGVYDDVGKAYHETIKAHKPGLFCIKHVHEEPQLVRIPVYYQGYVL